MAKRHMTASQHNRTLVVLHLAYAGFISLLMISLSIFLLAIGTTETTAPPEEDFFFIAVMVFVIGINLLMVVPSFLAGYAFQKRKSWAKTIGLVAAVLVSLNFPFGSALCVYTVWFLFGKHGRLFDEQTHALPPSTFHSANPVGREEERAYVPPVAPPDWR